MTCMRLGTVIRCLHLRNLVVCLTSMKGKVEGQTSSLLFQVVLGLLLAANKRALAGEADTNHTKS